MIAGKLVLRRAGEDADREIEPGRAELPLVAAERREVAHLAAGRAHDLPGGAVDGGVAATAPLVRQRARVADARGDEAVLDAVEPILVPREPGQRPDRRRAEQEAVGVAPLLRLQMPGERRQQHDPREVVVAERGVADVGREQDLVLGLARQEAFRVGDDAVLERGVDHGLVLAVLERLELPVRQAETPVLVVVRGSVRRHVRALRVGEEVLPELAQGQPLADGDAVAENVQVRVREVDDPLPVGPGEPRFPDVPLPRQRPVVDLCPTRHFGALERDLLLDQVERLPDAVAGEAAADRIEPLHELVHLAAGITHGRRPPGAGSRSGRPTRGRSSSARRSRP